MECPMPQRNDLSRSLVALDQDSTLIAVVEMSQSTWLVGGVRPGIERQPRKKLEPSPERLLGGQSSRIPPSCAREETPESRGMPCLFLNTERGFGGKPPQK